MKPIEYHFARIAATKVLSHLAPHHTSEESRTPAPDVDSAAAMIDTAFWASLRREEGFTPRISLAFAAPDRVSAPVLFEQSLPMQAHALTKLAPAVEGPGIHLGVWRNGEDLRVWGATRGLPDFCFVLEVVAPGLLVIKHSRGDRSGKFINIAVLEGDQIKIVDQQSASAPDCPALLTSLLGLETQFAPAHDVNVLIQLAISMRAHGRGGSLLVVPAGSESWRESILRPITYSISPAYAGLYDLMQVDTEGRVDSSWRDALHRSINGLAGLTAVDGATILADDYHLLAFGAKIVRRKGSAQVDRVLVTEPIEGTSPLITDPAELGGTRHLSAVQFAHDQRDSIALVASQDGRFTVFGWSPCDNMVHAHRIETVLL